MSKFKIKMKIQGFELEIEGSKEDIPAIANNLSGQIAGLIQPSSDIVQGSSSGSRFGQPLTINGSPSDIPIKRKSRGKKRPGTETQGNGPEIPPIEWKHDSAKYGSPR